MRDGKFESAVWWRIATLLIVLSAGAAPAHATCTFFVRAGFVPDQRADGRSPETAFAAIGAGVAAAINPGDVVCVGPGLYVEGDVTIGDDGISGIPEIGDYPIEIRADASGQSTDDAPGPVRIIPPTGLPTEQTPTTAFLVLGRHDFVIDGFDISGFSDAGIQVRSGVKAGSDNSASVTLRNNTIRNCRAGIDVHAEGLVIAEGNTTIANRESGITVEACTVTSDFGVCRGMIGTAVVPVVSNNRSGGNGAHGIFITGADGALVQNNVIYSNASTGITLRGSPDSVVVNNLVYANGLEGVAIGSGFVAPGETDDPTRFASPGAIVVNNTLYGNGQWGVEVGNGEASSPGASVVNNIVWRNGQGHNGIGLLNENQFDMTTGAFVRRQTSPCGYVAGFNLMLDEYGPDTPRNAYDLRGDPQFVDLQGPDGVLGGEIVDGGFIDRSADDDFHLKQPGGDGTSPAVDTGSAATVQLGLTGSTASDGRLDEGLLDVGFHYGASAAQLIRFSAPFMPLYVRASGDDRNDGLTPSDAFAAIGTAARRARAGVTVVVGPGHYDECDIHPPPYSGKAGFLGDASGAMTGDAPGVVLVDAGRCTFNEGAQTYTPGETGFDIPNVCGVVVDGFHVTGATDDGVQIQEFSDAAIVRNVVAFANVRSGISVVNAEDVHVINNLTVGNHGGIQVGGNCRTPALCPAGAIPIAGAARAVIEHNTAYGNMFNGIQVGTGEGLSTNATVRYNVTAENGHAGFEVGDDSARAANLVGYKAAYNASASLDLKGDGYGTGVPRGAGDLRLDLRWESLYVDPSAIHVDGDWLQDQSFRLMQAAAGQGAQCRAVDYGDVTAAGAKLDDRSTRTDGQPDGGVIDLGYHYPRASRATFGDCNADGRVSINELIAMVNVALGNAPLTSCPSGDAAGDGAINIDDLIRAVNTVLQAPQ